MRIVLLCFIILSSFAYSTDLEMKFIREKFYLAVEDESELEKLEKYIIKKYSDDASTYPPVILAYKGGIEALKAKHVFSPFSKFSHLMDALEMLDLAVGLEPSDWEVRFIRFSVLDNIPSVFGYNKERAEDKKIIISGIMKDDYNNIDKETQKGLVEYLLQSSSVTDSEKAVLNRYYAVVF